LVACRENVRILPVRLKAKMKMRNAPKPWTRKEEEELRALILSGKSVEAIAMKLRRSPLSIRNKAHN
jgi:DNA-binding NarL/FixJ family response regulator